MLPKHNKYIRSIDCFLESLSIIGINISLELTVAQAKVSSCPDIWLLVVRQIKRHIF